MKQLYLFFTLILFFAYTSVAQQYDPPVTFDDGAINYDLVDFGGNVSNIETDPAGGTNMVAKSVKAGGAELWAGTTMGQNGFANVLPFTANETVMTVRVYSPSAGLPIRLKVEESGDPTKSVETEAMTTVANAWDTLVFDFNNEATGTAAIDFTYAYDKASIFFNFGTDGNNSGADTVFYWDDVVFGSIATTSQIDLPVTFDDPSVDYTIFDFGGAASTIAADPAGGTNTVARSVKEPGAMTWAGTIIGQAGMGFANPIPLAPGQLTMSVDVYSPSAGIPVRFKVENSSDGTVSIESEDTSTVANAWETLLFDLSNNITGTPAFDANAVYDVGVVFFHFGTDGNSVGADSVFYWDNVEFAGASALNNNFNNALSIYPNPAQDVLHIQNDTKIEDVRVTNVLGQEIYYSEVSNKNLDLNLSEFKNGKYIIQIRTRNGMSTSNFLKN